MNESALGLYTLLERAGKLDSLDCKLWYQGSYDQVVQMFSRYPIVKIPVTEPHLQDASSIGSDIKTLEHVRLSKKPAFIRLRPMAEYFLSRIPAVPEVKGITLIRRATIREYRETDRLAATLACFRLPVRVVQLEHESFVNQVNIMRNTSILIAPHGAGTVNQMFMPRGGQIIELFPKGYGNWHAAAIAEVFGHTLVEIESDKPGIFGRKPTDEITKWIKSHGWPNRKALKAARSKDLERVIRDVESYSIDPERVRKLVADAVFKLESHLRAHVSQS
jgi:hypothetical protein